MRILQGAIVLAMLLLSSCANHHTSSSPTSSSAEPTTTTTATVPDAQVAAAAEQIVRDNFMLGPGQPFSTYECHSTGTLCWAQYITGFSFHTGLLKVAVQVDRESPAGKEIGENTATAVRNFLRAAHAPDLSGVDWVVATDGTGVDIAQEPMR